MYKLSTNNEARYSHLRLNYKLSKLVQFTKTRKREREKERENFDRCMQNVAGVFVHKTQPLSAVAITAIKDSALVAESLKCLRGVSTSSWPLVTGTFINQEETYFNRRRESYGLRKIPRGTFPCHYFQMQAKQRIPIFA